jgi:hypothetical protein
MAADGYDSLKVPDLKKLLKDRAIASTGLTRKAQYIAALREFDKQQQAASSSAEDATAAETEVASVASSATLHSNEPNVEPAEPVAAVAPVTAEASNTKQPSQPADVKPTEAQDTPTAASDIHVDAHVPDADAHTPHVDAHIPPTNAPVPPAESALEEAPVTSAVPETVPSRELATPAPTTQEVAGTFLSLQSRCSRACSRADKKRSYVFRLQTLMYSEMLGSVEQERAYCLDFNALQTFEITLHESILANPCCANLEDDRKRKRRSLTPPVQADEIALKRQKRDVEMQEPTPQDAVHPPTRALYIRNFMRPLHELNLRKHLISVAVSTESDADEKVIEKFYLDKVRTHAFVLFETVDCAVRARGALHGCIYPEDGPHRLPLWSDFIPEDKVESFSTIEREDGEYGRRWELEYSTITDGSVSVDLVAINSSDGRRTHVPAREDSKPTGQGVIGAPTGPRNPGGNNPSAFEATSPQARRASFQARGPNADPAFQTLGSRVSICQQPALPRSRLDFTFLLDILRRFAKLP